MTQDMLKDIIKDLKKKNKILLVLLIISIALFVGMTAFAFSSFEVTYEDNTDYEIEQDADTQGDNSEISQSANVNIGDNSTYIIVGGVIVVVALIVTGAVLYGKSKAKNHDTTEKEDND